MPAYTVHTENATPVILDTPQQALCRVARSIFLSSVNRSQLEHQLELGNNVTITYGHDSALIEVINDVPCEVVIGGGVPVKAGGIPIALDLAEVFVSISKGDYAIYEEKLRKGLNIHLKGKIHDVSIYPQPVAKEPSYEQKELDSLGVGEDLIIRLQLSYNGKVTKNLNITTEQFQAIRKILVDK